MSDSERIKKVLEFSGLKATKFAEHIGINTVQTIYDIKNGKHGISKEVGEKIQAKYLNINLEWLLTGKGEMLKQNDDTTVKHESITFSEDLVPLVPLNALGGTLVGFSEDSVRPSDCEMVKSPVDDVEFAIPIYGESMIPYYPSGCRVFVKKIDMSSYIVWGNVYVLDTTNGIILKEVQPSDHEGYIVCHSQNPSGKFKDFEVPLKDVRGMYRVMACLIAM